MKTILPLTVIAALLLGGCQSANRIAGGYHVTIRGEHNAVIVRDNLGETQDTAQGKQLTSEALRNALREAGRGAAVQANSPNADATTRGAVDEE